MNSFDAVDEDAIFFFLKYTGIYIFRVGDSGDRNK